MSEYNGWTNKATWQVNLEMFDGSEPEHFGFDRHELDTDNPDDVTKLAEALENYAVELVNMDSEYTARSMALSFLAQVDWHEIAEHMIYDFQEI